MTFCLLRYDHFRVLRTRRASTALNPPLKPALDQIIDQAQQCRPQWYQSFLGFLKNTPLLRPINWKWWTPICYISCWRERCSSSTVCSLERSPSTAFSLASSRVWAVSFSQVNCHLTVSLSVKFYFVTLTIFRSALRTCDPLRQHSVGTQ